MACFGLLMRNMNSVASLEQMLSTSNCISNLYIYRATNYYFRLELEQRANNIKETWYSSKQHYTTLDNKLAVKIPNSNKDPTRLAQNCGNSFLYIQTNCQEVKSLTLSFKTKL